MCMWLGVLGGRVWEENLVNPEADNIKHEHISIITLYLVLEYGKKIIGNYRIIAV